MSPVKPVIAESSTLSTSFYKADENFRALTDKIISSSWQLIGDTDFMGPTNNATPFTFYENLIDEPLVLIRNGERLHCYSNVCTHRGNLLVEKSAKMSKLVCGYHGRKFDLNGKFESMPEFDGAKDFPRPCDNLAQLDLRAWHQFLFISLEPSFNFDQIVSDLEERIGFLPIASFKKSPVLSKDYFIDAHWALYCENYLEGFHIPFVHPDLNLAVEYNSYESVIYEHCNLQIGYAKENTASFDLPVGHPDFGKKVAAYYYWIFPNIMLNFYPWGLSVNIVRPLTSSKTKVEFISYVFDESKIDSSAGALLDKVELEDEAIVQNVQRGVKSRFYTSGRFSPSKEQGVHHFHLLLDQYLAKSKD